MITYDDTATLLDNPLADHGGNLYWEWPVNTGQQIVRVALMGPEEVVCSGIWEAETLFDDRPLHLEITHLKGRNAASALIRRWRSSNGDEQFARVVLAGLGRLSREQK